jgi:sec-independent protein translocase protein TatB
VFESVGWGEILVLVVAALFILGPERLPGAAAWLGRNVRKMREFAAGAREQLREEMGPEFDELRKPLEDLRGLRNLDPKRLVTQHLFDGDADPLGLGGLEAPSGTNGSDRMKPNGFVENAPQVKPRLQQQLHPRERPPIDPDAT